jgi:hypothetical protein
MTPIFSENADSNVFWYSPDPETSPEAGPPTYVGITLHIANPSGPSDLTISDGASLRNAILEK